MSPFPVLVLNSGSSEDTVFSGTGTLALGAPYSGTISGFSTADTIDLTRLGFASAGTVTFLGGTSMASAGGYSHAAMTMALIYVLGLLSAPFLPETRGKPLPDEL